MGNPARPVFDQRRSGLSAAAVRPPRLVATRPAASVEVAGDHDPDRLHPAGHVAHVVETALGEDLIVFRTTLAARSLAAGLLDAEEVEPLVILVVAVADGLEVGTTAAGQRR
jgi:hypothetical protein